MAEVIILDPVTGEPADLASIGGGGGGGGAGTEYTEDAAAAADPTGRAVVLVRKDTPAALVSADGDNVAQRGTNYGAAYVTPLDASGNVIAGGGTQYTEDAAAAADPVGNAQILVRKDTPSTTVSTDGDNIAQRGTNYGAGYVTPLDANGHVAVNAEGDTPATVAGQTVLWKDAGGALVAVSALKPLPVEINTLDSNADSIQAVIPAGPTTLAKAEDAASANGDVGVAVMAVRRASPADSSGADGDYEMLVMKDGRLYTQTLATGPEAHDAPAAGAPVRMAGRYVQSPGKVSADGDVVELRLTQAGKIMTPVFTTGADTINDNMNRSSAATNVALTNAIAPGANKRLVIVEIHYSRDTAGSMKFVSDPAGTPADVWGPHYFSANSGVEAMQCYIPVPTNKALGWTSVGGGNETLSTRCIVENV